MNFLVIFLNLYVKVSTSPNIHTKKPGLTPAVEQKITLAFIGLVRACIEELSTRLAHIFPCQESFLQALAFVPFYSSEFEMG